MTKGKTLIKQQQSIVEHSKLIPLYCNVFLLASKNPDKKILTASKHISAQVYDTHSMEDHIYITSNQHTYLCERSMPLVYYSFCFFNYS